MLNLLFVCLGNICRSPAARSFMQSLILENNFSDKIKCFSVGTSSFHLGESPDKRMKDMAWGRNVYIDGFAKQITDKHLVDFDYIFAMDRSNYSDIKKLDKNNLYADKIMLFSNFTSFDILDVPDPYYGEKKDFEFVLDVLEDGCLGILKFLKKKHSFIENITL